MLKMKQHKWMWFVWMVILGLFFCLTSAYGADYPKKPIKMIIPWGPGSTSLTARIFNNFFVKYSPQPLIVVNKPGSAGVIGSRELLRSRPDGYTLLWESIAVVAVQPHLRDTGYGLDDFEYIIAVNKQPLVLFVPSNSPYQTLKDFVKDARKRPEKVSVALSGIGTLLHLAISDIAMKEKLELNIVPFAKGSEIPAQVAAGHIDLGIHHPPHVGSYVEAGQVRMLCTFSKERLPYFPDLPTAIELGYDVEQEVWQFILAPKDTPADKLKWIHDTFKKAMEDPGFVSTCKKLKIDLGYRNGADTYDGVAKASKVYKQIVDHLGLKVKKK